MNLQACLGKPLPSRCGWIPASSKSSSGSSGSSGGSSNPVSIHPRTKSNYRKEKDPSRGQNLNCNSWMTDVEKTLLQNAHLQVCPLWHHDRRHSEEARATCWDVILPVLRTGECTTLTGKGIHVWGLVALPLPQKLQICKLGDILAIRRP